MSGTSVHWDIEVVRGSAADFHARPLPDDGVRRLWWFDVDRPALVLGSTQSDAVADVVSCERTGVEVVRRHSGGGAVLLVPGEVVWFDVLVHRGDPLWHDDISEAAYWLGEVVVTALVSSGWAHRDELEVHRAGMVTTRWSPLLCFAGVGPGEVRRRAAHGAVGVDGAAKVLGLSQRRTRSTIRYQCAVYQTWDPSRLVPLLREPRPTADELMGCVATAPLTLDAVCLALPI